jgi:hypothetical protein
MDLQTQNTSPRAKHAPGRSTLLPGTQEAVRVDTPAALPERSVMVHHGIHRGRFPVAGMRVADARQALTRLLNIDPAAVAVINGRTVGEDEVIGEDVSLLSFVKASAVKG